MEHMLNVGGQRESHMSKITTRDWWGREKSIEELQVDEHLKPLQIYEICMSLCNMWDTSKTQIMVRQTFLPSMAQEFFIFFITVRADPSYI